jgi:hypothetical protein
VNFLPLAHLHLFYWIYRVSQPDRCDIGPKMSNSAKTIPKAHASEQRLSKSIAKTCPARSAKPLAERGSLKL